MDKKWALHFYLVGLGIRIYSVTGFTWFEGAPIVDAGSGFYLDVGEDHIYFIMTYHQYSKSLPGTVATALHHNGRSVDGHNLNIRASILFDARPESTESLDDIILLPELDVVLIPMPQAIKNDEVRVFRHEFLWKLFRKPYFDINTPEMIALVGYPVEKNGKLFYEKSHMANNIDCYTTYRYKIYGDKIEINLSDEISDDYDFYETTQGFSGSPIFQLSYLGVKNNKSRFQVALIGVVTSANIFTKRMYGSTMGAVLRSAGINPKFVYSSFVEHVSPKERIAENA